MPRILEDEKDIDKEYQHPNFKKRRDILRDTLQKLSTEQARLDYYQKAKANHLRWQSAARIRIKPKVTVLSGDWGDITQALTKHNGQIYAVLNMANAYSPGGGYLEGMVAQEENMFRRTTCHYHVADEAMEPTKNFYTQKETDLINAENGVVYLDTSHPRVCIKGSEGPGITGYQDLNDDQYFLFYELKSAADDLRHDKQFNENSMRRKIGAQLDTLHTNGIRHVVLSAFGCGAFANPPEQIARIYREELEKRQGYFDDVVFAIYHPGYGPDNFTIFSKELNGIPLSSKLKTPLLTNLLLTIQYIVDNNIWDQRGFAFIFFDARKTPKGIEQMRQLLSSNIDETAKLEQMMNLAEYRLEHPPKFTKRDDQVAKLYQQISNLNANKITEQMVNDLDNFELNEPLLKKISILNG